MTVNAMRVSAGDALAALLAADLPLEPDLLDRPAHPTPLAAPDGRPRLRIRRGGAWY